MSGFTYQSGDLDRVYMTTSGLFDSFVGDQLFTAGLGFFGVIGNNSTADNASLVTPAGGGTTWVQVSGGYSHTAAIKTDGTLWTWGFGGDGQLGNNATANTSSPGTTSGGGTTWLQSSSGYGSTAAVKTDGTLWTWGRNDSGNLGNGTSTNTSSPGTVAGGGTTWRQVAAGNRCTAAVKTDGTLWTWGLGQYGTLGNGTSTTTSSPGTVAGGGTTWLQVSAGNWHTAAVKTDGTLWTCGKNDYGQLGNGSTIVSTSGQSSLITPAGGGTTWRQVACGFHQTAAIKTDGTLWTWGRNNGGQLGTGTTVDRSSPGTVAGGGTTWKSVSLEMSSDSGHTAAIKTNGTLWTWGRDNYGLLGSSGSGSRSSPATVAGGITTWKSVACGGYHTVAVG